MSISKSVISSQRVLTEFKKWGSMGNLKWGSTGKFDAGGFHLTISITPPPTHTHTHTPYECVVCLVHGHVVSYKLQQLCWHYGHHLEAQRVVMPHHALFVKSRIV